MRLLGCLIITLFFIGCSETSETSNEVIGDKDAFIQNGVEKYSNCIDSLVADFDSVSKAYYGGESIMLVRLIKENLFFDLAIVYNEELLESTHCIMKDSSFIIFENIPNSKCLDRYIKEILNTSELIEDFDFSCKPFTMEPLQKVYNFNCDCRKIKLKSYTRGLETWSLDDQVK